MYNADRCKDISLRNHQQYIEIIDKLRKKTDKIILVQTLGRKKSDEILIQAMSCMELIDEKSTNEWVGTLTKGKSAIEYTFKATPEFFDYLKKFEAFFIV